jgi:hypothetical protein
MSRANLERDKWPKVVTASRSFTYSTEQIAADWEEMNGAPPEWDDVLELIKSWVREDFSSPPSLDSIELSGID